MQEHPLTIVPTQTASRHCPMSWGAKSSPVENHGSRGLYEQNVVDTCSRINDATLEAMNQEHIALKHGQSHKREERKRY